MKTPWRLLFCLCLPLSFALGLFMGWIAEEGATPAPRYQTWQEVFSQTAQGQRVAKAVQTPANPDWSILGDDMLWELHLVLSGYAESFLAIGLDETEANEMAWCRLMEMTPQEWQRRWGGRSVAQFAAHLQFKQHVWLAERKEYIASTEALNDKLTELDRLSEDKASSE